MNRPFAGWVSSFRTDFAGLSGICRPSTFEWHSGSILPSLGKLHRSLRLRLGVFGLVLLLVVEWGWDSLGVPSGFGNHPGIRPFGKTFGNRHWAFGVNAFRVEHRQISFGSLLRILSGQWKTLDLGKGFGLPCSNLRVYRFSLTLAKPTWKRVQLTLGFNIGESGERGSAHPPTFRVLPGSQNDCPYLFLGKWVANGPLSGDLELASKSPASRINLHLCFGHPWETLGNLEKCPFGVKSPWESRNLGSWPKSRESFDCVTFLWKIDLLFGNFLIVASS